MASPWASSLRTHEGTSSGLTLEVATRPLTRSTCKCHSSPYRAPVLASRRRYWGAPVAILVEEAPVALELRATRLQRGAAVSESQWLVSAAIPIPPT